MLQQDVGKGRGDRRTQRIAYLIGVVLQGQLSVGFLEVVIGAGGVDAKGFVKLCFFDHDMRIMGRRKGRMKPRRGVSEGSRKE